MNSISELINDFNRLIQELQSEEESLTSKEGEEKSNSQEDSLENECKNCEASTEKSGMELTDDVYMVDENNFFLSNKVNNINTTEDTEIVFTHVDGEKVVPGITENQLLTILLYKNRNDKRRYELVKQLLFC